MKVQVRFFTVLREVVGEKEETVEFAQNQEVTVQAVLEELSRRHGKAFADYVFDEKTGEVRGFLQFFINGKSTAAHNGLKSQMQNGDVLAVIPPVGGG
ncbi:MAG: MoaD family protein [Candidatus Bathyarchaeota archaeon]|nr:MoaD family protein [Candidatus Bathyarchaeota archaeon]